jgi:hypothetical protein
MSLNLAISSITTETIKTGFVTAASFMREEVTKITPFATKFFMYYTLYSMWEATLSDILCLKTFRHGTSPYAAVRIAWTGPDLKRAGKEGQAAYYLAVTGSPSPWADRDAGRQAFYVVEDVSSNKKNNILWNYFAPKVVAKSYSLRSTVTSIGSLLPLPKSWRGMIIKSVIETISANSSYRGLFSIFCPTVKFHIHPDRLKSGKDNSIIFQSDENAGDGAGYTCNQFSVLDTGIAGILYNGISGDIIRRIQEHRGQFLWGIAQFVNVIALTAFFIPGVIPGEWVVVSAVNSICTFPAWQRVEKIAIPLGMHPLAPIVIYAVLQL